MSKQNVSLLKPQRVVVSVVSTFCHSAVYAQCISFDITVAGRNSRSARPHYVDNPSGRRWGHRSSQRRSHNSQTWNYDMSSQPSQFVPAPRTSKYTQRSHTQSTRSYLNQMVSYNTYKFNKTFVVSEGPF